VTPSWTRALRAPWPWALLLVVSGAVLFPSSGRDDVHITYWAAHALQTQGAILNYSLAAVEQSSSLLHVLLLAALARVTELDLTTLGTPLSVLFGALAVMGSAQLARRFEPRAASWAAALAATCAPLVYWSFGALETTLVAFLLTRFVIALTDALREPPAAPLWPTLAWGALYVLVRPEAWFVLTAAMLATAVLSAPRRFPLTRVAWTWLGLSAVFALLCAWRLHQFGLPLPQPVYAKVSGHWLDSLRQGLDYLARSARQAPGLMVLLFVALLGAVPALRDAALRRRLAPLIAACAAQGAFLLASGGDWMEGARFFVPIIPALAALAALALLRLGEPWCLRIGLAALALGLSTQLYAMRRWSTAVPLVQAERYARYTEDAGLNPVRFSVFERLNRVHLRDALFLPRLEAVVDARLQHQREVVLMSAQAGMLPYHLLQTRAGRVRFIDMAGLTSREFPDCALIKRELPVHVAGGLGMTHEFYLAHREALERECGVPRPDIVFDLDDPGFPRAQAFAAAGYVVRDRQDLDLCPADTHCAVSIKSPVFVAELATP
jgi:hypothetical protein